jgi:hypothetical protein
LNYNIVDFINHHELTKWVFRLRRLLLVWFLSFPVLAHAQDEFWYEVEVLVFSNTTSEAYNSEKWPINVNTQLPGNALEIQPFKIKPPLSESMDNTLFEMPEPFTEIDPNEYQFQKIPAKLIETNDYEVLVHRAWRQPVIKNQEGTPVLVEDEDSLNAYQEFSHNEQWVDPDLMEEQLLYEDKKPVALDIDQNSEFPAAESQPKIVADDPIDLEWGLNSFIESHFAPNKDIHVRQTTGPEELRTYGTVTLKMSRFLHLNINMFYRTEKPSIHVPSGLLAAEFPMESDAEKPSEQETSGNSSDFLATLELEPVDFRLNDSRRIKTKEIYYFDHPLFGVLTMVTPIEIPETEDENLATP